MTDFRNNTPLLHLLSLPISLGSSIIHPEFSIQTNVSLNISSNQQWHQRVKPTDGQIGFGRVKMYGKTSPDTKLSHLTLNKLPYGAVRAYQRTWEDVHLESTHAHTININEEMFIQHLNAKHYQNTIKNYQLVSFCPSAGERGFLFVIHYAWKSIVTTTEFINKHGS